MLLQQPSHGRRPQVRPAESPRTADICHCAAVSSGGKTPRSSWLSGKSSSGVTHRSGHPLCHQEGTDPTVSLPPTAAPSGCTLPAPGIISPVWAVPGGSHPAKNPTMTGDISRLSKRVTSTTFKGTSCCFFSQSLVVLTSAPAGPTLKCTRSRTNNGVNSEISHQLYSTQLHEDRQKMLERERNWASLAFKIKAWISHSDEK